MKPKHPPILPYFLLLFLGFSTAFLFFLAFEKTLSPAKMVLVKEETPLKEAVASIHHSPSRDALASVHFKSPLPKIAPTVLKTPRFSLRQVRSGRQQVPRVYVAQLPKGKKETKINKQAFIKVLLPLILAENERVLKTRERLVAVFNTLDMGQRLNPEDRRWLHQTAQDYRVKKMTRRALLACVDVVPPSLALAQAILETGFGSSQAATKKHSVFGHMATLTRVAAFPNLGASVKTYVQNLNRHPAYSALRSLRAAERQKGTSPSGSLLAQGLGKYSIRQNAYIRDIQHLIKLLALESYDKATLQHAKMPYASLSQN